MRQTVDLLSMPLTALVVCAELQGTRVLDGVLREMNIKGEHCNEVTSAGSRLESEAFDIVIVDCKNEAPALKLIGGIRKSKRNKNTLAIALLGSENNVRAVFATGCNFVLYKPLSALHVAESLRAARGLIRREKRRSKRVRLQGRASISYAATENAPAQLLDLSEDGIKIRAENRLPPGSKVYFQFNLPGQVAAIRLSARMIWQDESGSVGFSFADVPQASRRLLNEWLNSNQAIEIQIEPEEETEGRPSTHSNKPTQPAGGLGLLQVSASDRRIKSRHACRLSADVYKLGNKVPYRSSLSDISTGGCYVETTEPFPVATSLEIVVRTPQLKLHVLGTVQTVHPGYGMGVEFVLKTAEQRLQVQQLIACAAQAPELV